MGIENLGAIGQLETAGAQLDQRQSSSTAEAFKEHLKEGVQKVNEQVKDGDEAVEKMVESQGANIHETMIELNKADLTTKLTAKVGQKAVEAYQTVSQIQV